MWRSWAAAGAAAVTVACAPRSSKAQICAEGGCACPEAMASTATAPAPGGLTITYYGVSTLMFSDGRDRLLIDGFFSRPSVPMLAFPIGPNGERIEEGLGKDQPAVLVILTAHAHHDHALDTAAVALTEARAVVVGTPSVARLVGDRGVRPSRICVPVDGRALVFGPYRVTPFYVDHGPASDALRLLLDHPLTQRLSGPAWFGSYKDDKNLSYLIQYGDRRILVHPSSGPRVMTALGADTVFLGVGRVGNMDDRTASAYLDGTIGPRTSTLVPIHWDQFTTRLGKKLEKPPRFMDEVDDALGLVCRRTSRRTDLAVLRMDALGVLKLPATGVAVGVGPTRPLCEGARVVD